MEGEERQREAPANSRVLRNTAGMVHLPPRCMGGDGIPDPLRLAGTGLVKGQKERGGKEAVVGGSLPRGAACLPACLVSPAESPGVAVWPPGSQTSISGSSASRLCHNNHSFRKHVKDVAGRRGAFGTP